MNALKIVLQVLGIIVLVLAAAIVTLRIEHRNGDGPSILFPGGAFVTGEVYSGPEPDWRFTDDIPVIELQIDEPLSSRRTFIMESDGRVYVPSGYMRSFLGRIWKDWAFEAAEGDGSGAIRINGIIYPRRLVRVTEGPELDGVVAKMRQKYAPEMTRAAIESGDVWIFRLAPPKED